MMCLHNQYKVSFLAPTILTTIPIQTPVPNTIVTTRTLIRVMPNTTSMLTYNTPSTIPTRTTTINANTNINVADYHHTDA